MTANENVDRINCQSTVVVQSRDIIPALPLLKLFSGRREITDSTPCIISLIIIS